MKPSAEIAEELHLKMGCNCSAPRYCACKKLISQAIDEAIVHESNASYRMGRKEAFERAAEIADEHNGCVDIKCLRESNCGASIAQAIRSEAEKV